MKYFLIFLITNWLLLSCQKSTGLTEENIDILEQLQAIENITVTEMNPKNGFDRQFEVYIDQPLNHDNPNSVRFQQRIFISHHDINAPVIFMPSGYSSSPVKVCELAEPLGANQVYAAHRFMTGACPANMDWRYLTVKQAAADFHRVVELFKTVYKNEWISYGASKNGQSALFHRRFYPDDVTATVAKVAPLSHGAEDPRYDAFLVEAGSAADREKIQSYQRAVLRHRDQIELYINSYTAMSDFNFTRLNSAEILEFEVLEFPFSFWQITDGDCSVIPDSTATALELFNYIKSFGYLDFYSDELLAYYEPVYYQAYTELGWYRLIDDHLNGLIQTNPSYRKMAPSGVTLNYDPSVLQDIEQWLKQNGEQIFCIYGQNDPWTAGAIESMSSAEAFVIVQPGANHSVRIDDLDERDLVYSKLGAWMSDDSQEK